MNSKISKRSPPLTRGKRRRKARGRNSDSPKSKLFKVEVSELHQTADTSIAKEREAENSSKRTESDKFFNICLTCFQHLEGTSNAILEFISQHKQTCRKIGKKFSELDEYIEKLKDISKTTASLSSANKVSPKLPVLPIPTTSQPPNTIPPPPLPPPPPPPPKMMENTKRSLKNKLKPKGDTTDVFLDELKNFLRRRTGRAT